MDQAELMQEAVAAAEGHAATLHRLADPLFTRLRRAAVSGSQVHRAELVRARLLAEELQAAELRRVRLRQAAGLRAEC